MSSDDADKSLDTLAAVLRVWGDRAFNLPAREAKEIARELEGWAAHLLLGRARPGATEEPQKGAPLRRDYLGLRQFLSRLRAEESEFVRQALSDFRQTVHGLVSRVRASIAEERVLDARLEAELERLRSAAAADDLAALRSAAESAADVVSDVLGAHRARYAAQEAELAERLETMGRRLESAERQAEQDALTGLTNRRGFDAELSRSAGLADQFQVASSLLIVDLDHFKAVNDRYGHPGGDAALRAVADALTRAFPRRGDCVARFGGEEFAVILRESRLADAQRLAERFVAALRGQRIQHEGQEIRITASVGVAELRPREPAAEWLARADKAVYAAKAGGRDRVVVSRG